MTNSSRIETTKQLQTVTGFAVNTSWRKLFVEEVLAVALDWKKGYLSGYRVNIRLINMYEAR